MDVVEQAGRIGRMADDDDNNDDDDVWRSGGRGRERIEKCQGMCVCVYREREGRRSIRESRSMTNKWGRNRRERERERAVDVMKRIGCKDDR